MTDLKYNNPNFAYYGKNMMLYAPEDYYDPNQVICCEKKGLFAFVLILFAVGSRPHCTKYIYLIKMLKKKYMGG